MKQFACLLLAHLSLCLVTLDLRATVVSTSYGISRQVNVDASGQNIPGDAANEPSLCVDPTNPYRIAIGWRQFDTTNSNFRQSGVAYTTNGGLNWTFPGNLDPGTFRSDPVLASDANGVFYYLGISNANTFACDLLRSTDGGATWQPVNSALGGNKEWMAIDTTSGPGRGNIYQIWSPFYNVYNNPNRIFTRSIDSGNNWMPAIGLPQSPYFGTIAIGPNGEVYNFGTVGYNTGPFWINRSSDATNRLATPTTDVSTVVDLGGSSTWRGSIQSGCWARPGWRWIARPGRRAATFTPSARSTTPRGTWPTSCSATARIAAAPGVCHCALTTIPPPKMPRTGSGPYPLPPMDE